MNQQINGIIEIIKKIIDLILGKNKESRGTGPMTEQVETGARFCPDDYTYDDDDLFRAVSFSDRIFPKNLAVIHFSWTRDLASLTDYFSRLIPPNVANSTYGVGKDGTCHRYLPDIRFPSWTSNGVLNGRGIYARYIDPRGNPVSGTYVNDNSVAFEVVNIDYESYTDFQYRAVARRILYMMDIFPDFRLWRILGHEHCVPICKNDPGPKWDWEYFFTSLLGVRRDFYDQYLKFLADTAYNTVGDQSRSDRKQAAIDDALARIGRELSDKDKRFCL